MEATRRLSGPTARLDAEILAAHSLGMTREAMLLNGLDQLIDAAVFGALIARRELEEPIAYITGHQEFWSLDLAVTEDVLIPRADTETLIEVAKKLPIWHCVRTVADLGTGSGALLIAALVENPRAWGLGIDRSEPAVRVARANATSLGVSDRSVFIVGDWASALGTHWDLILCNPPYIAATDILPAGVAAYEPPRALRGGLDGCDCYRVIIPQLASRLVHAGIALLEIGHTQADLVISLVQEHGLLASAAHDLGGRQRVVIAEAN